MRSLLLALSLTPVLVAPAPSGTSDSTPNPTVCGHIVNATGKLPYPYPVDAMFSAKTVYECLTSVPFNPAVGSRLLKYVNDTIQFHSTLAYLANPPPGYQQPGVDLVAGLSQLQHEIDNGVFGNEYVFEAALHRLLRAGHDDHLAIAGGILSPFFFGSPLAIASVSLDGIELPKVYITDDLFAHEAGDGSQELSAVATINGQDVVEYLTEFAAANAAGKLEPHAEWNMLMQSGALDIQGYNEVFYGGATFYPGESITFGLENGTTLDPRPWDGLYFSPGNTGPLETGGDFYNFFVLNRYPASYTETLDSSSSADVSSSSATPAPSPTDVPETAYPRIPDVMQSDFSIYNQGLLRGYFLNESSLAVLSIPQFVSYTRGPDSFTATVRQFLERSRQAGLRKVVIDLQQNSGGQPLLAIEIFRMFFPSIAPFAASRRRAHDMADALGSRLTPYWQNLTRHQSAYYTLLTNEWVVASRLDASTRQPFISWDDYFDSPASYDGDHFTKLELYDLSNRFFISEAAGITTDNVNSSHPTQPYQAEDIIILTDGLCSSACALFMELMHQAGVRTVVVGGQPRHGPMQAPSGTRGAAVYNARRIDRDISTALQADRSARGLFPDRTHDFFTTALTINLRDQIRAGNDDASSVPLQFRYEAADCRIFYTPSTWYNYTNLWTYAADAIWSDSRLCVATSAGSQTHPQPQQQAYTVNTNKPGATQPGYNPTTIDDPSNDIFSDVWYRKYYDLHPCNETRDCAAGGRYSCQTVNVCQNGFLKSQKRCLQACSTIDNSCSLGYCDHGHLNSALTKPKVRGGRGRGPYSAGHCVPPVFWGCYDRKDDQGIYRDEFDDLEKGWLDFAKGQGLDACDLYDDFEFCYTLDGRKTSEWGVAETTEDDNDYVG
ncbi:hypothetical protein BJX99DRAFT_257343 [Aspergillus californicus]